MPNFNVNGYQYYGRLDITGDGVTCGANLTDIYNGTPFLFTTENASSSFAFNIKGSTNSFDWSFWSYSVTFTPINLVQLGQSVIPFFLSTTQLSTDTIQISMIDVDGNDFVPNDTIIISYYINIRLETTS